MEISEQIKRIMELSEYKIYNKVITEEYDNRGLHIDNEEFLNGMMSDTPDYLHDFEVDCLKKMRR